MILPKSPEFLESGDYLESKFRILKLDLVEAQQDDIDGETTVSLQVQLTFDESQMEGDEPTEDAIGEVDQGLRSFLESKYEVNYLELLDDALTSHLLGEREELEAQKYPEAKQRDLTVEEKSRLRARIDRGDSDIYQLAAEFGCSASQVAGIKAAMQR